jgi:hypothetical protein
MAVEATSTLYQALQPHNNLGHGRAIKDRKGYLRHSMAGPAYAFHGRASLPTSSRAEDRFRG